MLTGQNKNNSKLGDGCYLDLLWCQIERSRAEQNHALCSNRDAPRDDHTKSSQTEKDKCHVLSLIGRL